MILASLLLLAAADATATPSAPIVPATPRADVVAAIRKGVDFLVTSQEKNGSWGAPRNVMVYESFATHYTYEAWTYATTGLCAMALADCGQTPEQFAALDRGIDFLLAHPEMKRISEWDTDNVWGYVYGTQSLAHLLQAKRFAADPRRPRMLEVATQLAANLARWQTPMGGWGYYEGDVVSIPNTWETQFTTAAGVIGLLDAKAAGVPIDEKVLAKAIGAVAHCRLPNGAYTYNINAIADPRGLEYINQIKGSLGRIQVGNVVLARTGQLDAKEVKRGLELFFEHHRFLAVGREKPIPHESWYQVAAYFFLFGHYYASEAIELLPADQRAPFLAQLQDKLLEVQEADGSSWDFYISSYSRPYGTAFSTMALQRTLNAAAAPVPAH